MLQLQERRDVADMNEYVSTKLNERLEKEYQLINKDKLIKSNNQVRNIVVRRQNIFQEFIQGKLIKPCKHCPRCASKKAQISIINNSMIICSGSKKAKKAEKEATVNPNEPGILENKIQENDFELSGRSNMTPIVARNHLRELWKNEKRAMSMLFKLLDIKLDESDSPVDVFFLDIIPVMPNRFRPLHFLNGKQFENEKTSSLSLVFLASEALKSIAKSVQKENEASSAPSAKKSKLLENFHFTWNRLQILCNRIYDSDMDHMPEVKYPGIKQVIEKKEGLFRKNFMGKRVNYAARSVISPDPYIMSDEIGIPLIFATKLSYPQHVTPWNLKQLKQAVINGPEVHPGANAISLEDGQMIRLKADDIDQRKRLANILSSKDGLFRGRKFVHRHLLTGDILLLNRQPTLHKPSIMAHRAKVLKKEKTLRLHYANCKCYNADFDGDEMNAHFPQSELARAEGYNIVGVKDQYLVPKDGSPLSGLIQDHIIAGTLLSLKGNLFTKADYQELVFNALSFLQKPIELLKPSFYKPHKLWSGKQVISTVIHNLIPKSKPLPTIYVPAKVSAKILKKSEEFDDWTPTAYFTKIEKGELCESSIVIRNGELLCGLFDKSCLGNTHFGFIHCCYEMYGGEVSNALMTSFARLGTFYLQIHGGSTLGLEDILVEESADAIRTKIIKKSKKIGDDVITEAFSLPKDVTKVEMIDKLREAQFSKDPSIMKQLDAFMKTKTDEINNEIVKACIPAGLIKKFLSNNLQMMIQSGAKGGTVNAIQISCLLGQIELEGRRVPLMMSGRTLPSFLPYATSLRAGGFVTGRFLTGIRPQEFFFHCMAGREGLIDTAVKTSRSGYLQRCLIKHLEGLVVNYDSTVRDSDGSIIQFQYGEDGLDILKSQLLDKSKMSVLIHNFDAFVPSEEEYEKLKSYCNHDEINKMKKKIKNWESFNGTNRLACRQGSAFQEYFQVNFQDFVETSGKQTLDQADSNSIIESWFKLNKKDKNRLNFYFLPCPGPLACEFCPASNFGVISEKLKIILDEYIEKNCDQLLLTSEENADLEQSFGKGLITEKDIKKIFYVRYMRSLCDPGEAVGLLAAQSIGEPSTQMTLNTFHFAGRSDMNVTLGIPRLREILMTASPMIATPNMDIPFLNNVSKNMERKAEQVRLRLNAVRLSETLEKVVIKETLSIHNQSCCIYYDILFQFLPHSAYKKKLYTNPKRLINYMVTKFIKHLVDVLKKRTKIMSKFNSLYDHSTHTRNEKTTFQESVDDGDDDEPQPMKEANLARKEEAFSSDEEEFGGDEDTTMAKSKANRNQDLDYEEPEEEEIQAAESDKEQEAELEKTVVENGDEEEVVNEEEKNMVENFESGKLEKKKMDKMSEKKDHELLVKSIDNCIDSFDYDAEKNLWCQIVLKLPVDQNKVDLATLIEEEAKKVFVHKVGSIQRAFLVDDKEASKRGHSFSKMIKTEGVSFMSLVNFNQILDLNRVYSNDIHAIANIYGIEAARKAIILEIANVFAVYGIQVDYRHLSLIADYMTFDGTIKGMNRMSFISNSSPIQQMTFETTTNFLKSAILLGKCYQLDLNFQIQLTFYF